MNQISVSGVSLNEFCDLVANTSGLDINIVNEIFNDITDWLGINYNSITYAFVYLSDLIKNFNDFYDDENQDEIMLLETLNNLQANQNEDYFIVFND